MKKNGLWVAMAVWLIAVLLTSCGEKGTTVTIPKDYIDKVRSTDLSAELRLAEPFGTTEQEIVAKRGAPQQRNTLQDEAILLDYPDYQFDIAKGKLVSYGLKPGQPTEKQLLIGDAASRIDELYGPNSYTRKMAGITLKGYLDPANDIVIEFGVDADRVKMILVSQLSNFKQAN